MITHHLFGKPVLVTGGAGFIGSQLVSDLMAVGADITVIDNESRGSRSNLEDVGFDIKEGENYYNVDLRDPESQKYFEGFHTVYHLAADVGGIAYALSEGIKIWRNNTLIDANVFESTLKYKIPNLVHASSSCVYPLSRSSPRWGLKETQAWQGEMHTLYGGEKLLSEKALQMHVQGTSTTNTAIVRFHNVYGPRSIMKGSGAQVVQALIARALNYPQQDLEVWGSGRQGRDFIYVSDITHWLVNLWLPDTQQLPTEPVQRGSGINTPIRNVAQHILDSLDLGIGIDYVPVVDEGEKGRKSNNARFDTLYAHLPKALSIQQGIREYISWAIEHEHWWQEDSARQPTAQRVLQTVS
ncbi:MAG: NAD-dependent epimerase/dehydratase family protein [Cyanobacteria bacterium J06632_3]